MQVVLTGPAEADLEEIADYIGQDNPFRADSFVAEIVDQCLSLGEAPHRYPVYGVVLQRELRRCRYGSYLIFYSVLDDHIEITRVLHGARDYNRIFFRRAWNSIAPSSISTIATEISAL